MNRWFWLWGPVLILVVGLLYGRSARDARLPEEDLVVWSNHAVTGSDLMPLVWGRFYDSERDGFRPAVRPVATTALRWELGIFHQNRGGFQWTQIILLAAAGMLFGLVLYETLRSTPLAFIGGFLLALHPLATASVLNVAGVSDLLAMCFLFLSVWAAHRFLGPRGRRTHLLVSAGALLMAVWSKEAALAGVPVLWAMAASHRYERDGTPGQFRRSPGEASWGVVLVGAATIVFLLVLVHRAGALGSLPQHLRIGRAVGVETGYSFARRLAFGLAAIPTAARLLLIPLNIGYANDFLLSEGQELGVRIAAGSIVMAALVLVTAISIWRREQVGLWLGLLLFPLVAALGIFDPNGEPVAPRLLFMAVPGVIGLLLHLCSRWFNRSGLRQRILGPALAMVIAVVWSVLSSQRVSDYRDWETLVRAQIRTSPESSLARFDLGNIYLTRRDWGPAQAQYEQAVRLRPDFWMAYVNLGSAFFGKEDIGLAMRAYERALAGVEGKPAFATVEARADYNRALILMRQNRNAEAARSLTRMLEIFPNHLLAHANLGFIYSNSPQFYEQAHYHLARALELETDPERLDKLRDFMDRVEKRRQKEIRRREGLPADTSGTDATSGDATSGLDSVGSDSVIRHNSR